MEELAIRKDYRELCTRSADDFRAEPLDPSKLGFRRKSTTISPPPQPSKGGIFKIRTTDTEILASVLL